MAQGTEIAFMVMSILMCTFVFTLLTYSIGGATLHSFFMHEDVPICLFECVTGQEALSFGDMQEFEKLTAEEKAACWAEAIEEAETKAVDVSDLMTDLDVPVKLCPDKGNVNANVIIMVLGSWTGGGGM